MRAKVRAHLLSFLQPSYGWRWAMRPFLARLRGQREPARFALLVGQRD